MYKFWKLYAFMLLCCLMGSEATFAQKKSKKKAEINNDLQIKIEEYFTEAQKYFILEDFEKAYKLFGKALELAPENAAIHYKLAKTLQQQEDNPLAIKYAEQALSLDDENKYYYLLLVELLTDEGDFESATVVFEDMLDNLDNTDEYLYDLASLHLFQNNLEQAILVYQEIEDIFGISEELVEQKQKIFLKLNQVDKALAEAQKLVDAFPEIPEYSLNLAEILISNNKKDQAITTLNASLEANEMGAARMLLYRLYREQGDDKNALEQLTYAFQDEELSIKEKLQPMARLLQQGKADTEGEQLEKLARTLVAAHPDESNAYAVYGDMLLAKNQPKEAKSQYIQALELNGDNFSLWQNVLDLSLQLEAYDDVIEYAEDALELFPNQAALYYFQGTAFLVKKEYRQAVNALEQGKKRATANFELQNIFESQLGDAYNGLKEYEKADAAYESALAYDPDNQYVLNNYSYYLSLRKEKLEQAKKMSSKLVKSHPKNSTYLDTHAWVLYTLGEYKEAKKHLEKALQYDDEPSGTIIEHYGDVLFKLGETDKALVQWQKAKGLNDTSELIDKKIADRKLYE